MSFTEMPCPPPRRLPLLMIASSGSRTHVPPAPVPATYLGRAVAYIKSDKFSHLLKGIGYLTLLPVIAMTIALSATVTAAFGALAIMNFSTGNIGLGIAATAATIGMGLLTIFSINFLLVDTVAKADEHFRAA